MRGSKFVYIKRDQCGNFAGCNFCVCQKFIEFSCHNSKLKSMRSFKEITGLVVCAVG